MRLALDLPDLPGEVPGYVPRALHVHLSPQAGQLVRRLSTALCRNGAMPRHTFSPDATAVEWLVDQVLAQVAIQPSKE